MLAGVRDRIDDGSFLIWRVRIDRQQPNQHGFAGQRFFVPQAALFDDARCIVKADASGDFGRRDQQKVQNIVRNDTQAFAQHCLPFGLVGK